MKILQVKGGYEAVVDDDDYEFLSKFTWYRIKNKKGLHGANTFFEGKNISMHRLIMELDNSSKNKVHVKHANGDKLDNRKCNLLIQTYSKTGSQSRKRCAGSSRFKGVRKTTQEWRMKKWYASIYKEGSNHFIGFYETERDAAIAYDEKSTLLFGSQAMTNRKMGLL